MRKWLIPWAVLCVIVAVAAVVWYFHFAGRVEMSPEQRSHLKAEAERLVANRENITQPDAAWIADRLGRRPSADDLARLGQERLDWLHTEHAAQLERDFPELWSIWDLRGTQLTGTNGDAKLAEAGDRAEALHNDERFKDMIYRKKTLSPGNLAAFIDETEPLIALVGDAAAADHLVWIPRRMERWLDPTDMHSAYYAFRVLSIRVRLLAEAGRLDDAVRELTLLIDVYSRVDWNLSLIGTLLHVIAGEEFLLNAALALVEGHDVEPETARFWLARARSTKRDPMLAVAVDLVQTAHINLNDSSIQFAFPMVIDLRPHLPLQTSSVEELFSNLRRNARATLDVAAYVQGERISLLTPEGQQQTDKAFQHAQFHIPGTLVDHVEEQLKWAALELRLAERERGKLDTAAAEEVIARWPGLRAEWDGDTLQLWVRTEYRFGREPDSPLYELKP